MDKLDIEQIALWGSEALTDAKEETFTARNIRFHGSATDVSIDEEIDAWYSALYYAARADAMFDIIAPYDDTGRYAAKQREARDMYADIRNKFIAAARKEPTP